MYQKSLVQVLNNFQELGSIRYRPGEIRLTVPAIESAVQTTFIVELGSIPHGCLKLHSVTGPSTQFSSPLPAKTSNLSYRIIYLKIFWFAGSLKMMSDPQLQLPNQRHFDSKRCDKPFSRNNAKGGFCSPMHAIKKRHVG